MSYKLNNSKHPFLRSWPISGELAKLQTEIEAYAKDFGLDFFPTEFQICDYDTINILASQGGFPTRYPHWNFGMEYDQLSKSYSYGLTRIYEMVINTNPCYAYLLVANNLVDQKIVIAHVLGHNDFFKNNAWFSGTNRKMMDVMANHSTKVRRYMERYGHDQVEAFIDRILSLDNLLDVNLLFEHQNESSKREELEKTAKAEEGQEYLNDDRSQALKAFMRSKKRQENEKMVPVLPEEEKFEVKKFPLHPERDVLKFVMDHAPLEEWQVDILGILRDEAYYFLPQRMTKIMNEGWASYWHSRIMTEKVLKSSEIIDFADRHAGVMQMSKQNLNPYKIGIELFRDIEYRWNTGKFGKEYNECESMSEKQSWNKNLMQGMEKIFEVRKSHNDITFIDEFLTPEFCERQQIFTYKYNPRSHRFEIETRDFEAIKSKLLLQLTNFGTPVIEVENANFSNRGELLLNHLHYGADLDMQYAQETMRNLYFLWKRPINLKTIFDDKEVVFHYDGKEMRPLH